MLLRSRPSVGAVFGAGCSGLLAAVACQVGAGFICSTNEECQNGEIAGVCEPTGACSFTDDTCDSGQRYGQSGPDAFAGDCVPVGTGSGDMGSSDDGPISTSGTTTDSTLDSADTAPVVCPPDWWDCDWSRRQRIELDRFISTELLEIPVPILLVDGRVDHDAMQNDGEDIRFVSASGTVAPYEIERWDPAGVSTFWINLEALGGSADHLWIYYGNPVAQSDEDPDAVWPEPYAGVWHLEDEPLDSSGEDNHGTTMGNTEADSGQLANSVHFLNSTARIDVEASPSLADVPATGLTVTGWMYPRDWGANNRGRIIDKYEVAMGWLLYIKPNGVLAFGQGYGGDEAIYWETVTDTFTRYNWVHFAVTFDALGGVPPNLYVDGIVRDLNEPADPPMIALEEMPSDAEIPLYIGNKEDNTRRFEGRLDEVRVAATVRSAQWIGVQHDATRDELFSFGPIESLEIGGTP